MTVPRRALLVEDEPLVAMLVVDLLNELGFEVIEAGSGKSAIEAAQPDRGPIELAVVDLGLPDTTGDKVIAELKRLRPELPIIVASGAGAGQNPAAFATFKKLTILPKPYEFKGLSDAIAAVGVALP